MKTQAELREIAECIAEAFADDRRPLYRDAAQLAADYLRLTDSTPLTAEHCDKIGFLHYDGCTRRFTENRSIIFDPSPGIESIECDNPTVGLLYAARRNNALSEIRD